MLLTDTVGFVRNLPHRLVEAFKSTLEEAVVADFLIHVLDASDPGIEMFYQTTLQVLDELGAADKPSLVVLNKIDRVGEGEELTRLRELFSGAVEISAKTGIGIEGSINAAEIQIADRVQRRVYRLPQSRGDLYNLLHIEGKVIETQYEGNDIIATAVVSQVLSGRLRDFLEEETVL